MDIVQSAAATDVQLIREKFIDPAHRTITEKVCRDVREALATLRFPVMQADISQRVAFAEASAGGQTVLDMDPKGRAAREIEAFLEEILTTYDRQEDHHDSQTSASLVRGG
jgi:cellulose biosynthesis protein BcsQ